MARRRRPTRTDDPPGTTRTRSRDRELAGREGVFVDEGEAGGHVGERAKAESEQDALLDPGVDRPAAVNLLGGANFALRELVAEFKKGFARFGIVLDFTQRGDARWRISET